MLNKTDLARRIASIGFGIFLVQSVASRAVWAVDAGVEFGAEDDLTVNGTAGTNADADLEIKGYSVFGSGAGAVTVTSGAGSLYVQNNLELGGTAYFITGVGIGTTAALGALLDVDRANVSSNSELVDIRSAGFTQTITGAVANARLNQFNQSTFTAGSAQTVTNAATLYVANAPAAAGSATITNPYALWVDAGKSQLDGTLQLGIEGTDGQIILYNELGATDYTVTFNLSGTQGAAIAYTLPPDDGDANEVLQTNGSGTLTWEPGGGDVSAVGDCATGACFGGASGTILTSTTSEALNLATPDTLIFSRNDAGSVSFMGADDAGAADTIYDTTGAGAITVGSADVTSITLTTDGTGTGEVVLPLQSVAAAEIVDDTLSFAQISDSSAIDADTTFTAADTVDLTYSVTHTAGDTNFLSITAAQTDDANATDDFDALKLNLSSESGDAGDTFDGIVIAWANGTANTVLDSALKIDNAETTASTLTDAILVTSSGVNNGVVDAIDASDANITNALNAGANVVLFANGGKLDMSLVDNNTTTEGILLPQDGSCAASTAEGQICWDDDDNVLYVGNASTATAIGSGDVTDVFSCASGDCSSIALADGDFLDMSGVTANGTNEGLKLPTYNSGGTAEGQVSWDGANDALFIGNGSAAIPVGGSAIYTIANCAGGAATINWNNGMTQHITLTQNCTLTFSNGLSGRKYILIVKQDGTGSRTITWPSDARFLAGGAPTLTTGASKTDYVGFIYNSVDSKYDSVAQRLNF